MRAVSAGMAAVVVVLIMLIPHSAHAEAPNAADVESVTSCLKSKQGNERAACADVVASPCIGDETAANPDQIIDCFGREQLVWDKMLNDAYATLRGALDDDQRVKLRDTQRSWLETRKLTCAFYYDYFQGSMANPMMANCENRETARRAVFLMGFVEDAAGRVNDVKH
jgi:uncharacterized protein YecT (DUF1311 family)